jgi:hypothetical protein
MQKAWIQLGGAVLAAVLTLLAGTPLNAADDNGVRPAAEELAPRTKPTAAPGGEQKGGLSDSAVRVLMTYAFSIIPDEAPGPDGKPAKVDKSDPNKFVIPTEDARRVIHVATRSAYAEVCGLPELERANYETLMRGEQAKKVWSHDQMLLINALHIFAVSYFTGSVKITAKEAGDATPPAQQAAPAAGAATSATSAAAPKPAPAPAPQADAKSDETQVVTPKRPDCPPEQKQKVANAINAYVQAAKASAPAPAAAPAQTAKPAAQAAQPAPVSSGSN